MIYDLFDISWASFLVTVKTVASRIRKTHSRLDLGNFRREIRSADFSSNSKIKKSLGIIEGSSRVSRTKLAFLTVKSGFEMEILYHLK